MSKDGNAYAVKVAKHGPLLKNLEAHEKAKAGLPPLKPMIETLKEFMTLSEILPFSDAFEVTRKIGGLSSKYYHVCYWMTKLMLLETDSKRRSVILHGKAGSGKSQLAKYNAIIFDSHTKNETRGMYDEKITKEEANKQLLVMNEANMFTLFSRNNIPMMKKLLEGDGSSL